MTYQGDGERRISARKSKIFRWAHGSRKPIPPWLLSYGILPTDLNLDSWLPGSCYSSGKSYLRIMCELARIPKPRYPRFITAWVVPRKPPLRFWYLDRERAAAEIRAYAAEIEMVVADTPKWVDCSVRVLIPKTNMAWFGTVIRIEDVKEWL